MRELADLDRGLDERDGCAVLVDLTIRDAVERVRSERSGEWMYVFEAEVAGTAVYVKVVLREQCVVVSFHREAADEGDEGAGEG